MDTTIIVALISFAGTAIGTFGGIMASTQLIKYRLEKLEQKVDKHNHFAERMPVLEEKIEVVNHRIADLEQFHKPHNLQN